jgi:hypothetical protein
MDYSIKDKVTGSFKIWIVMLLLLTLGGYLRSVGVDNLGTVVQCLSCVPLWLLFMVCVMEFTPAIALRIDGPQFVHWVIVCLFIIILFAPIVWIDSLFEY